MSGIEPTAIQGALGCPEAREAIQVSLDGLPPDPRIEAHLASCPPCRTYRAGLQSVVARLDAAAEIARRRSTSTRPPRSRRPRFRVGPAAREVAAVLAVGLLVLFFGQRMYLRAQHGDLPLIATVYEETDPDSILCLFGTDPEPGPDDLAL